MTPAHRRLAFEELFLLQLALALRQIESQFGKGSVMKLGATAPALVQGANTVYVRQLDVAGNAGASTSFTFTYDSVAPATTIATATATTTSTTTTRQRLSTTS